MDGLKKQILLELIVTPFTVVPTALGVALMLLSFVIPPLSFFGFLGVAVGFGALVANIVANSNKVAKRAAKRWHEDQKKKRSIELDKLDAKLVTDRDSRTQQHLRDLRQIYFTFVDDMANGKIKTRISGGLLDQIDKIFEACVSALRHSHDLWENSRKVSETLKDKLMDRREAILEEVGGNVQRLFEAISEVRALGLKTKKGEIEELQKRLERDLKVAQQVDEMASITVNDNLDEKFGEYLTE